MIRCGFEPHRKDLHSLNVHEKCFLGIVFLQ
nr:MAG TPA: hypothetical protein [Bacteriophage sp.]